MGAYRGHSPNFLGVVRRLFKGGAPKKCQGAKMHCCSERTDTPIHAHEICAYEMTLIRYTPIRHMPVRYTPMRCMPMKYMPIRCAPVRCTPIRHMPMKVFYEYLARQNTVPAPARVSASSHMGLSV